MQFFRIRNLLGSILILFFHINISCGLPEKLHTKVDSSCTNIPIPRISNGKFIIRQEHFEKFDKTFLVAKVECFNGYQAALSKKSYTLYCSKGKWIGKLPKCLNLSGYQSDQPKVDDEYEYVYEDYEDDYQYEDHPDKTSRDNEVVVDASDKTPITNETYGEYDKENPTIVENKETETESIDNKENNIITEEPVEEIGIIKEHPEDIGESQYEEEYDDYEGEVYEEENQNSNNENSTEVVIENATPPNESIEEMQTTIMPPSSDNENITSSEPRLVENTTENGETDLMISNVSTQYEEEMEENKAKPIECQKGYHLVENECTDIDECETGENTCSHECENTRGNYQCLCPMGLQISRNNVSQCEDIDECVINNPCSDICLNTIGSFECQCPQDLVLQNTTTCVNLSCSQGTTKVNGIYQCSCTTGFVLGSDGKSCEDIDECVIENSCQHFCQNTLGSFQCSCNPGYTLSIDERHCVDINECLEENDCPDTCLNIPGSFTCICKEGLTYNQEMNECLDIDECQKNLSQCEHICINYHGGYECGCNKSFYLASDDVQCLDIDECLDNNGGCSQNCENTLGSFNCNCQENYQLLFDNKTCTIKDPCLENNGNCSHYCVNEGGVAKCTCPDEYVLKNDNECMEINLCSLNNGNCSHFCDFQYHKVHCSCPEFHILVNDTQCIEVNLCEKENGGCSHICRFEDHKVICLCPMNTHENYNDTHCVEKNPCMIENGGCSHNCSFTNGMMFCGCPENYYLEGKMCFKMDPCLIANGGCSHDCFSDENNNVECGCPENFGFKDDLKNCILEDPCMKNNGGCSHFCTNLNDSIQCSCPENHELINGKDCFKVNPCQINNGGCSHDCHFEKDIAICSCPVGYQLFEKTCLQIDPCLADNGGCSHICTSKNEQVLCSCPIHYELLEGKTCVKINPCSINNGGCSHYCYDNNGEVQCNCPTGYKLLGKQCLDKDPCRKKNGGCSHYCLNVDGKRKCSCPSGYLLRRNQRVCKDINECKINRGGCSHGCKNTPGSYECTCPNGFRLQNDNISCIDINECEINNGGCEMLCKNYKGSFRCGCPENYILESDERSCKSREIVKCNLVEPPDNGVMRCPGYQVENETLVPIGTKCNVWCNEGYKLKGSSERICNHLGQWDGFEVECLVASCPKLPTFDGGWFIPGICNTGKTFPGESCTIHCRRGFKKSEQFPLVTCNDDLKWSIDMTPEIVERFCLKDIIHEFEEVSIKCPHKGYMNFVLPAGQSVMKVEFPQPETNVDFQRYVISDPLWGKRLGTVLPVGNIEVAFTAFLLNRTATCKLQIEVRDQENPEVISCPGYIEKVLDKYQDSQAVYWNEPVFRDNIAVVHVYKSRAPGTEFVAGIHHISYVAMDAAGNRGSCTFTIEIKENVEPEKLSSAQQFMENNVKTTDSSDQYYKAVLICPSGAQYENLAAMIPEPGCVWRHIRVPGPTTVFPIARAPTILSTIRPFYIQRRPSYNEIPYSHPKIYPQSRLPSYLKNRKRKEYFRWTRR